MHKLLYISTTKLNWYKIGSEHVVQVHILYIIVNDIEDKFTIVIRIISLSIVVSEKEDIP
jgi:hypothetical protein